MPQVGSGITSEIALTAATAKTVIQLIAASGHRVTILGWGVFFDGTSAAAEPVQVDVIRQTSAGTGGDALTLQKFDDSIADALATTALSDIDGSEPTGSVILDVAEVHPQAGYEIMYPFGQEIIIGAGDRVGIRCNAPAAVNVRAKVRFQE